MLTKTTEAGRAAGIVDDVRLLCMPVDITVIKKNIAHPTDARLDEKAGAKIAALAKGLGIDLRQTDARKAPSLAHRIGRDPTFLELNC